MAASKIWRGALFGKAGFPNSNSIRVDPTTEEVYIGVGASGTTEKKLGNAAPVVPPVFNFATLVPSTETAGSIFTTGTTWVTHSAVGSCAMKFLTSYSGASGDFACARFRARADAAGNVDGVNASASASVNDHGNLCGVYAAAQPTTFTQAGASHIAVGMHSVIDATGASSGRRWSTWIDDHSTTKAAGGHYLCRLSQNGSVAIDGVFTVYTARVPFLFNFEEEIAGGFFTETGDAGSTKAGYIAVKTPVGTKYIQLVTA